MRNFFLGAALAAMALSAAPSTAQGNWDRDRDRSGHDRGDRDNNGRGDWHDRDRGQSDWHGRDRGDWQRGRNYDWNRPDPRYGGYDASRYYHAGRYQERRLGRNDRIYRGRDGRYYCRRSDGTTGLIVGGVLGGVLGNVIADGQSSTLATLLGAGGGALLGRSVDRGNVRCR